MTYYNKMNQGNKVTKKQSSDRMDYGKGNKKREEQEDFDKFESFNSFVKETGWKKHSGQTGKVGERKTEPKTESKTGTKSGATARYKSGSTAGYRTGSTAGYKTGLKERAKIDTKTGSKIEAKTGLKQGITTSNRQPGAGKNRNRDAKIYDKHAAQIGNRIDTKKGACPYQKECGGCNILHDSYEKHLAGKQKVVDTLLKKYCKVEPIIGMKQPDHYRYKVHAVFDHDRKGNPISGVYEEGTHRVISVDRCLIHNEKADAIIATIRGMLKSFKILTYDEDTGYGLLRHVLIRTGYHSGEIMVVLVLASPIMPSKNNFVKALRKEHPEITTVVVNVNDKQTSMVLGDKEQVIYGKGYIEDSLCGKTFRISPKSFYQVNPSQTEILYQKAIELAELSGKETVIDAYCGTGTIGLIASDKAKKVIGVELNKDAVHDAVVNAKRNEVTNIEFYNNDAGVFMSQMAAKAESADVVFMDPPRTGSTPQFMDAVAVLKPSKVVYVSCNPDTLARDLEYLTKKGYKVQTAIPVDMFPWTSHVEAIILMTNSGSEGK